MRGKGSDIVEGEYVMDKVSFAINIKGDYQNS
jgi:hypothetical protein